jgi:hypothetical protein
MLRLTHDLGAIADKYEGFEPSEQPVHDDEQKRAHGTEASAGGPMLLYQDAILNIIVICVCVSACVCMNLCTNLAYINIYMYQCTCM